MEVKVQRYAFISVASYYKSYCSNDKVLKVYLADWTKFDTMQTFTVLLATACHYFRNPVKINLNASEIITTITLDQSQYIIASYS